MLNFIKDQYFPRLSKPAMPPTYYDRYAEHSTFSDGAASTRGNILLLCITPKRKA